MDRAEDLNVPTAHGEAETGDEGVDTAFRMLHAIINNAGDDPQEARLAVEDCDDLCELQDEIRQLGDEIDDLRTPREMHEADEIARQATIRGSRLADARDRESQAWRKAYSMHLDALRTRLGVNTPPIELIEDPHGYRSASQDGIADQPGDRPREQQEPPLPITARGFDDFDAPLARRPPSYFDDPARVRALHELHERMSQTRDAGDPDGRLTAG